MIIVLLGCLPSRPSFELLESANDVGRDEPSPSVVDWDAVEDERCGLFP